MFKIKAIIIGLLLSINVSAQTSTRPVQPDFPGDFMFDFGFNFYRNRPDFMDLKWFPSRSFGFYYLHTIKLSDRFVFNPGIGVTAEKFAFDKNMNFVLAPNKSFSFDTLRGINPSTNKLAVNYIELPLEIRFFPTKTIDGEGFFIALGGVAGYRIESHTKIRYEIDGRNRAEKDRADFGLRDFRIGAQARVGWKFFNIYYKQYITTPYRRGPFGADPTHFSLGINFTGF